MYGNQDLRRILASRMKCLHDVQCCLGLAVFLSGCFPGWVVCLRTIGMHQVETERCAHRCEVAQVAGDDGQFMGQGCRCDPDVVVVYLAVGGTSHPQSQKKWPVACLAAKARKARLAVSYRPCMRPHRCPRATRPGVPVSTAAKIQSQPECGDERLGFLIRDSAVLQVLY